MEKWEYITEIIWANIENKGARDYLAKKYPNWKPAKYAPETMQAYLDRMGEEGWELVQLQPIAGVGKNMDVHFLGEAGIYSNAYFCVLKRRKQQ